ncbi:MAG: NACHT domain-containing protein [Candidatus Electrothrix sp. AU1_5]|nr:NACHT domain-containing protein [Candidatus Electrothrix gigas]
MGHSLYVSGAQQFVPAFYRRLLETANVAEAVRAGRQAMLAHDQRPCLLGEHALQDWLVPVLYQQMQTDETVLARPVAATPAAGKFTLEEEAAPDPLPEQARHLGDDGFIGRQQVVQQLERARLQQEQAAFLIHGMAGVGKTTLAKGFLHWLRDTGGLDQQVTQQVFWFSFDAIRSAEFVINELVDSIFGTDARAAALEQKLAGLIKVFQEHPFLLIWDNFESASGLAGTEVRPMLAEDDRGLLKELLAKLRGGKTKVLITSRSTEKWLSTGECFRLPLSGLHGEELWQFCNQVLRDLGLRVKRDDEDFRALIEELDGNPLALRTVLLQLQDKKPAQLLTDLRKEFALLDGDESSSRILAALAVLDQGLPEEYGPVLQLIGLHRRFVDQDYLGNMLKSVEKKTESIQPCFALLEIAGLISTLGNNIFQMHPALQTHLEQQHPAEESLQRTFVDFMVKSAYQVASKELHVPFALYGSNLHHALKLAQQLGIDQAVAVLTQSLADHALKGRDYKSSKELYADLAEQHHQKKKQVGEAGAYHQLGIIAEAQRDFAAAERWYKKALEIYEKEDNEHDAASTYYQLGTIAEEQWDFAAAEQWYQKALEISEKQGDEYGVALTCHQLGIFAQKQRNFETAEQWYKKSLEINEKQDDEHGTAVTYHQLGTISQEQQQDFSTAEQWYKKALEIYEKEGDEYNSSKIYNNLGTLADAHRDFSAAEQWYKKSLAINEKQGDEYGAAGTYHNLGMIAQEQRDFTTAEQWYKKSLEIKEKQGDEHGSAGTYQQLGTIAQEQRNFSIGEKWYKKALAIYKKLDCKHADALIYHNLGMIAREQRDFATAEEWCKKALAINEGLDDEGKEIANNYHYLGVIADAQRDFLAAEKWYEKSLAINEKQGDEHGAAITYNQLGGISYKQGDFATAEKWYRKALAIYEKQGDEYNSAKSYHNLGTILYDQEDFEAAEKWYKKSLKISEKLNDKHGAASSYAVLGLLAGSLSDRAGAGKLLLKAAQNYLAVENHHLLEVTRKSYLENLKASDPETQAALRQHWQEAGLNRKAPLENSGQTGHDKLAMMLSDYLDTAKESLERSNYGDDKWRKKRIQEYTDTSNELKKLLSEKKQQRTEPERIAPFEHLEQTRHDREEPGHHTTLYNWLIGKISCIFKTVKTKK